MSRSRADEIERRRVVLLRHADARIAEVRASRGRECRLNPETPLESDLGDFIPVGGVAQNVVDELQAALQGPTTSMSVDQFLAALDAFGETKH